MTDLTNLLKKLGENPKAAPRSCPRCGERDAGGPCYGVDCSGPDGYDFECTAEQKMIRAGGDVICEICGERYYDHPMDMKQLSYDGHPFLHIHCDGTRLKL